MSDMIDKATVDKMIEDHAATVCNIVHDILALVHAHMADHHIRSEHEQELVEEFRNSAEASIIASIATIHPNEDCEHIHGNEPQTPFLAVGNNEPLPEHLPEELKRILRESRRRDGWDDNGHRIQP